MPLSIGQIPVIGREATTEILKKVELDQTPVEKRVREVKSRYDKLASFREQYLWEARMISQAVIPYLYPPVGTTHLFTLPSANQSLVAKGVMNLAKELASTIFPSNGRFFENKIKPNLAKSLQEMQQQQGQEDQSGEIASIEQTINNKLIERDDIIRKTIKTTPDAENVYQLFIHNQVGGEVCFFKPNVATSKIYTLEEFVAEFDSSGEMVEVIVRDAVHVSKFTKEQLKKLFKEDDPEKYEKGQLDYIEIYTRQVRRFDHWEIQVEVAGQRFPDMEGHEHLDAPPFIVIPFILYPGRKYGVGWCSQNRGDIIQYENLTLALNELSKAACKVIAVIPPELKLTQQELASTPGMSWAFGNAGAPPEMIFADVSRNIQAIQPYWQTARTTIMALFLLNEAVQRQAERVTAEEIQTMMGSLRNLLGGLYLSLARRWQYPYLRRMIRLMEKEGLIPEIPEESTELVLTAGVESMESEEELQSLDQMMNRLLMFAKLDPTILSTLNKEEFKTRLMNYLRVVRGNLWLTQDQEAENAGVTQIIQMAKQMGPQGPAMVAQLGAQLMQQMMGKGKAGGGGIGGMLQGAGLGQPQPPPPGAPSSDPSQNVPTASTGLASVINQMNPQAGASPMPPQPQPQQGGQ
jgi:hypothetical protein